MKTLDTILADNLNLLMREHALSSNEKVSIATGLGTGTIQRSRRAESSATLKTIETLARAFRITPSKLITENLGRSIEGKNRKSSVSPAAQDLIERITAAEASGASSPQLISTLAAILDLVNPVASPNGYPGLDKLTEE